MKTYKLLKDLPFAKAGEELCFKHDEETGYFTLYKDLNKMSLGDLHEGFIENFDEWFEKVKEPKIYFTIDFFRKESIQISEEGIMGWAIDNIKSLGFLFETQEKAKKHLKYLQMKEVIKQDTKGFKPDWQNTDEEKYYGEWDFDNRAPRIGLLNNFKEPQIYFKSYKDIKESFKKHPNEWKTYLTYEQ